MKRYLVAILLTIMFVPSAWADVCMVSDEPSLKASLDATSNCHQVVVQNDIAVTLPVDVEVYSVEILGMNGREKVSAAFAFAAPVFSLVQNDVDIHDLVIENTAELDGSSAILVTTGTINHEIHNVEFQNCYSACVYLAGSGKANIHNNTFVGTDVEKTIKYVSEYHPGLDVDYIQMVAYDAWAVIFDPSAGLFSAELYKSADDGSINSIVNPQTIWPGFSAYPYLRVSFDQSTPQGRFHVLGFEPSTTMTFTDENGISYFDVDWTDDTNFDWGLFSACDNEWFTDADEGLAGGDYDGDGILNGEEDLDHDCERDANETDPANADTDDDGFDDNVDNCPLQTNVSQSDVDGDGVGDICDPSDDRDPSLGGDGGNGDGGDDDGNHAPAPFSLVYPENGATDVSTDVVFRWKRTTDEDGDEITYFIELCENAAFDGCEPIEADPLMTGTGAVTNVDQLNLFMDKSSNGGASSMLFLLGAIAFGGALRRRRRIFLLIAALALMAFYGTSCGGSGELREPPILNLAEDELGFEVEGLNPNTTYYWKVTASDGRGGNTTTETWSFTTAEEGAVVLQSLETSTIQQ